MILVNTDFITGKKIETISIVKGSMVKTKHIGVDLFQAFKHMVGGELRGYSHMMDEARATATKRMVEEASLLKADAIVNVRYATSNIMQGAAEVIVYGTAVKFV